MTARTRNALLILAGMAMVLVFYDYMTGAEWAQFVGGMLGALL